MIRAALVCAAIGLSPAVVGDALADPQPPQDLAFITSQNADMVSVVDLHNGTILAETPVAGGPAPVVYDPERGLAYVISAKDGRLSALDESGAVLWARDLGEGAFGLAAASGGGLFVTDWYNAQLKRLDPEMRLLWQAGTGAAPAGVATSADGSLVATADRDADQLSIFDAGSGKLLHQVATGSHPYAVLFHDGRFWTTNVQSDDVSVIDPVSGTVVGSVATGSHPYGIAFAGGRGFVTDQYAGTVTVFDATSLAPVATLETGDYPEGIAALPDGTGVAVVHWESNSLVLIAADSLQLSQEIALPDGPRAFGSFAGRRKP